MTIDTAAPSKLQRADSLHRAGRNAEAWTLLAPLRPAIDSDAQALRLYALVAQSAGRTDEAIQAVKRISAVEGMNGADVLASWAAATLDAGRIEQAEHLYRHALAEDPTHRASLNALSRILIEFRGESDAFSHYEAAVAARGFAAEAYLEWIDALMRNKGAGTAAEVAGQALARHPDHPMLRTLHPFLSGMTGDPGVWLDQLEEEAEQRPLDAHLADSIQVLSIRARRWDRVEALLRQQLEREPDSQVAWAKLSIVWRIMEDPREHWLCDYERFVMVTAVPSADGLDPAGYARVVASVLDPLHQAQYAPGDQTLVGGTQTSGELFARPDPELREFRESVLAAASAMVASLPEDPTHPFLRRKSGRLGVAGSWSVRLSAGGRHVSHVHNEGWMSSAYYARLPEVTAAANDRQEGWIHFGVPPESFGIELPPRRIVEPREGRLVLFPSYMWHGTMPFGAGDRLTAAFDFQPL